MKKRNFLLAALLLILVAPSFAAKVDTLLVNSPSMNKDVQVVVVTQKSVGTVRRYIPNDYLPEGLPPTWKVLPHRQHAASVLFLT